jgi:hypothetical protein
MKRLGRLLYLSCLIAHGGVANANAQSSNIPGAAWFGGLGGSYNSVNFGTQNLTTVGTSNTYSGGVLVDAGTAAGPSSLNTPEQSTFAPSAQVGYFRHFADSNWLWGAKFTYSYLNATATYQNLIIPQTGSFVSGGTTTAFTGNALAGSYQTILDHQMAFLLFAGRSIENVYLYLGAGPSLSQTQTRINGLVGFADINGMHTMITTAPTDFSSSHWVWGGAVSLGATYFLSPTWFLDFSYTYDATAKQTSSYFSTFANAAGTQSGTLSGTSAGTVATQAVTVTINTRFDYDPDRSLLWTK